MEFSLDHTINEVLDLLDEATRKLSEMPDIEVHGWEEICEAKDLLEKIPFGLTTVE